ncbi:MAG TPA: hypothetical protein VJ506_02650 [Candidatus Limnocylindrales bacterium]|nr:hypothetical protein [Candidatus Limnocylindrales bacterium]
MEIVIFFVGAFVVGAILLYRSRTRTGGIDESPTSGLPDDLRDKNVGMIGLPNRGDPWTRGGR